MCGLSPGVPPPPACLNCAVSLVGPGFLSLEKQSPNVPQRLAGENPSFMSGESEAQNAESLKPGAGPRRARPASLPGPAGAWGLPRQRAPDPGPFVQRSLACWARANEARMTGGVERWWEHPHVHGNAR